jgi:2-phosphosulfolactate phosphatase
MKVSLFPALHEACRYSLRGEVVVVIDVLRFTSTVIAALDAGAREIIPARDVETALSLAGSKPSRASLLAGERMGMPVEGFDLFNSPLEFGPERVGGATIIMSTSNGSRAVVEASSASRVIICAINNISAVARGIGDLDHVYILCSGSNGGIAIEDFYCGGLLIELLGEAIEHDSLGDAGLSALMLARSAGSDAERLLRLSMRGKELVATGYEKDIIFCSKRDMSLSVPEVVRGAIRLDPSSKGPGSAADEIE